MEDITNTAHLRDIHGMLGDIRRQVSSEPGEPQQGIVQALEGMQAQLQTGIPGIMEKLNEMADTQLKEFDVNSRTVLRNLVPSSPTSAVALDLSDISSKLDRLLTLQKDISDEKRKGIAASTSAQAERDLCAAQALELSTQVR